MHSFAVVDHAGFFSCQLTTLKGFKPNCQLFDLIIPLTENYDDSPKTVAPEA